MIPILLFAQANNLPASIPVPQMVTLTSAQVPAVRAATALVLAHTANITPGGAAPEAQNFSTGESSGFTASLNENAARLDLDSRYGGGGNAYSVCWGLNVTWSGSTLSVTAGHALVEGLVEVFATLTTSFNPAVNQYIWLNQGRTLTVRSDTSAPAGKAVYLGVIIPGNTLLDQSGVVYAQGDSLVRYTTDGAQPTDTPPDYVSLLTVTQGGTYRWVGNSWVGLGGSGGTAYFGNMPHTSGDSTTHDNYTAAPRTGVHVTVADRADILANAAAALAAQTTANTALSDATTALANAATALAAAALAVQTGDSRLSNARTPTAHAGTHAIGGGDAVIITSAQMSDIVAAVFSIMQGAIVAGPGVTINVNTGARTFTFNAP